jgi:hypothetical protein
MVCGSRRLPREREREKGLFPIVRADNYPFLDYMDSKLLKAYLYKGCTEYTNKLHTINSQGELVNGNFL